MLSFFSAVFPALSLATSGSSSPFSRQPLYPSLFVTLHDTTNLKGKLPQEALAQSGVTLYLAMSLAQVFINQNAFPPINN
jgi:hypothetical protein